MASEGFFSQGRQEGGAQSAPWSGPRAALGGPRSGRARSPLGGVEGQTWGGGGVGGMPAGPPAGPSGRLRGGWRDGTDPGHTDSAKGGSEVIIMYMYVRSCMRWEVHNYRVGLDFREVACGDRLTLAQLHFS